MNYLVILNDPPYGTERSYNGLRLTMSLAKRPDTEVKLFLMADAAACGKAGQRTPDGYYNLERMLKSLATRGVPIGACGSCLDARGIAVSELLTGVHRGSMDELTDWTVWADKVTVF
ncbi:DsrE family protein [candidate division KSB1 bacterium]|nr:DsrE family protein [candidate division KSB1 bacterium]